jgi:septal ring factor EnvC (AmiA/AmiB activator)
MDTGDKIKEEISRHKQEVKNLKKVKETGDTKAKLEAQIKDLKSKIDDANAK